MRVPDESPPNLSRGIQMLQYFFASNILVLDAFPKLAVGAFPKRQERRRRRFAGLYREHQGRLPMIS